MAVYFKTTNPSALLKAFNDRIDQEEPKGKIRTWKRHEQHGKKFYSHTSTEWANKAYFTPVIGDNVLVFNIRKHADFDVTVTVYGYYHGHLTETFLNHFDNMFTDAVSSSNPRDGDIVANKK